MEVFDVIIVGAGPAGLRCAEILGPSGKKILVLEKKPITGPKVCAGGITRKSLELMEIPDSLFELKINKARIVGPHRDFTTKGTKNPFTFIINRKTFGQWQQEKLKKYNNITLINNAQVTEIQDHFVVVNHKKNYKYQYLVGADGATSKVRRFLQLPSEKYLISFQYLIPKIHSKRFEIHMNDRYFRSGYGWIFPHADHLAVGCLANPRKVPVNTLKKGFLEWLRKEKLDVSDAVYQSFPIAYDYRGYRFGNIFLCGEAAGLASGLTGEGIYAALLSGEEIAKIIINPDHPEEQMKTLLRYKKIQDRFLNILHTAGIFRNFIFRSILYLMNNKRFNQKVTNGFSG